MIQHWISHWLGTDNGSGSVYLFVSGIGGDLGYLAIVATLLRKHNCAVKGCVRLGRHKVEGTEHVCCRRHHPEDHRSEADIHRAWLTAKTRSITKERHDRGI